jgi:glyoxylase-like metal-dependent hydrolase (beta-lactamase superfamily II)
MAASSGIRGLGVALVAFGLSVATTAAAAPAPVAPEAREFPLGGLRVFALRDADNMVANDGMTFGVGHSPAEAEAVLRSSGAPPGPIRLSVDALLVEAPGRVMLFDTGLGPSPHGALIESLAKAGVSPGQVTDVFITHSHGDHVGGLRAPGGGPAFPHAVIHISAREWAWMKSQPLEGALVQAISAQVKPFEPGVALAPGVEAVALYGHTPGHVGYQISAGGAHLIDMGDTAHSSVISLARPDWAIEYDTDAVQGRRTREAELARLARSGELVFGPHMPFPGVGRVVASGEGYAWRPAPAPSRR